MTQPARRTFLPGHVVVIICSITIQLMNLYHVYTGGARHGTAQHGTARLGSSTRLHCTIFYRARSIVKGGDFVTWGE